MKRVITTNDPQGRSRILIDEEVAAHGLIWETRPGSPLGDEPVANLGDLDFPEGGIQARMIEIPADELLAEYLRHGIAGHDADGFHRTGTIDFLVLLEGRLRLILDDGAVELAPGDVVVQRDTNHAWRAGETSARCFVVVSRPEANA
ncbi:hypothetical protein [Sphingobium sp. WCS2017Hpa-17]|uniref:hypothetical protein n=1 Tax=Sphingobium sp. WCS2017Hpa-17 TaxID=3073638 RepID=UPI00288AF42B|nr:hypothetical protein [Sphingobium sp. WCS2017Hpa-17]